MTMSSNLIPILSSSPPPLNEGTFSENDDDEFGDFTAANETNYDVSSNSVVPNLTCVQDNHVYQPGKQEDGNENNRVSTEGNFNEDEQQFADFSIFSTLEQPKHLNGFTDQNIDVCITTSNQMQSEAHHKSDLVLEVNEHHKKKIFLHGDELEICMDKGGKSLAGVSEFESAINHDMNSSFEEEQISDVKFVTTTCFKTDIISSEKLVLNSDQITSSHFPESLVTLRSEHDMRPPLNSSSDKVSTTFHNYQKENNGDSEACKIEQSSSATSSSSVPPLNISDDEDEFFNSDGSTGSSPETQCCTKLVQESTHVPEQDKSDIQGSSSTSNNSKFINCSAYMWNTQNVIPNDSCFVGENLHKGIANEQEDVEKDDVPELDLPEVDDFDFGSFTMAATNENIIHDEVGSTTSSYIDHDETKSYPLVLNKNISSKAFEGTSDLPDVICALDTGVNEINTESLQKMEIANLNREGKHCKIDSVQSFGENGIECFENIVKIPNTVIINEFPTMKLSNDKYEYDEFQCGQQIMQEKSSVGERIVSENDDFGNFESAKQKLAEPEGFADFENASFSESVEITSEVLPDDSDGNFADFVSSAISGPILNDKNSVIEHDKNSDDFAAFESAQSLPCLPTNLLTGMVSSTTKLKEYFTVVFPGKVLEEHVHMKLDQGDHEALFLGDRLSRSHMLWGRLQDIEETPALLYQWGGSRSCQHMLCSLNIDTRNILIPPVQFDWRTSGLINPLESELSSSALLDLDFFSANDAKAENNHIAKTSSLEEEFLGPTPQSPQKLKSEPEHQPHLLEKLLSSVKSTTTTVFPSKQATRPPGLSSEAKKVLDKLPDLSFMQAKVLMFPVRSSSLL
ncbi:uncharacterized protein LOC143252946 isoform X2 [Tachypleus tridentatus]|uniref:uncharacterized protein LOC143252946 isoform X2 n=1 Tax=Tachypleus tridentatus TaxID=6853 RepID=UPI003FCF5F0D